MKDSLGHSVQMRVRYSETDQMKVVYHGSYMPYFEISRVEWLRSKGISYKSLEDSGIALPIASMTVNYKKSARYDDLLTVNTKLKSYSGVKIEFECEIVNETNELLTNATFLLVFIDVNSGKPVLPPQSILNIIEANI